MSCFQCMHLRALKQKFKAAVAVLSRRLFGVCCTLRESCNYGVLLTCISDMSKMKVYAFMQASPQSPAGSSDKQS